MYSQTDKFLIYKKMLKIVILIVFFICIFYTQSYVSAATIYINSSTGNDTTGYGTSGTPYKTFTKGYTEASSGDTIDATGTFSWSDDDETGDAATTGYTIGKNLIINGQGANQTIFQASSTDDVANRRVFTISNGIDFSINDATIRYGKTTGTSDYGGCLSATGSTGNLSLDSVEVHNCRLTGGSSGGGGIYTAASTTIENSAIYSNVSANYAGGILFESSATAATTTIVNTSLYSNQGKYGGAVGLLGTYNISLTNCTITDNVGTNVSFAGAGLYIFAGGKIYAKNTIVARNYNSVEKTTVYSMYISSGTFISGGYNIMDAYNYTLNTGDWNDTNGDGTFLFQGDSDFPGSINFDEAAGLNDSPNNTRTWAILTGSIAIDNATTTSHGAVEIPITDQRGSVRNGTTDIGAFEFGPVTIPDITAPTVSYLSPADNATGVSVDATFEINFNEAIATSTGDIVLYKASDNSVVETIDITDTSGKITASSTTALIIDPSTTLASETEYYFTIASTTIDDLYDNSYAGATTTEWSFTTADVVNPTVLYLSPADNATSVALDNTFEIAFNEAISTSTGNIVFYKAFDNSVFETIDITDTSGLITASGTTALIIDPDTDFSYETEYYITIASSTIDDASGNSYAGATTTEWSFTTLDTPTCATVANAATYNTWPTCGVATCNSGYTLTGGACVVNSSESAAPPPVPTAIGDGAVDVTIPMNEFKAVGDIDNRGINALMYINSHAQFNAVVSSSMLVETHGFKINSVDLANKKVNITISSEPIDLDLNLGEKKLIDLDNDNINDIEVTFADLVVNRVEITIKELDKLESNINDSKQEKIVSEDSSTIQITNEFLYNRLKGKIILKVEEHGEAYYIHPTKQEMFYLGRPDDAFRIMREQGIGITNSDLEKIPSSIAEELDISKVNYFFANKHKGKIFLQVQVHGEAYYVYPDTGFRYYLGRPDDAFRIMRELGLGISNENFNTL